MASDRLQLPTLCPNVHDYHQNGSRQFNITEDVITSDEFQRDMEIRCHVGSAVMTGPGRYGPLPSHIIHAVGPNFACFDEYEVPKMLLRSAYASVLDIASDHALDTVGFSLLSAGIYRGNLSLEEVLLEGIQGISDWSNDKQNKGKTSDISEIWMFAFLPSEVEALVVACDQILGIALTDMSTRVGRSQKH